MSKRKCPAIIILILILPLPYLLRFRSFCRDRDEMENQNKNQPAIVVRREVDKAGRLTLCLQAGESYPVLLGQVKEPKCTPRWYRLGIMFTLTILLSFVIMLVVLSYPGVGITSEVGTDGLPLLSFDRSAVPRSVMEDASELAEEAVG